MKKVIIGVVLAIALASLFAAPVVAQGPENAGGIHGYVYNYNSQNYVGPDYGAGSTETVCVDGTWIDVIVNATLMANGHYFLDEEATEWTEKDWVYYKFWLDEENPVEMLLGGTTPYTATKFIALKQWLLSGDIELINYK